MLQRDLVRGGVAVEVGGGGGDGEGGAVGVFVGVEEDVGAVVGIVTGGMSETIV